LLELFENVTWSGFLRHTVVNIQSKSLNHQHAVLINKDDDDDDDGRKQNGLLFSEGNFTKKSTACQTNAKSEAAAAGLKQVLQRHKI